MKSINFNKIFPASIFIIIYSYLLINVLIPYFRFDKFQFWDAAGHYFAAWLNRNYFFPSLTGWNPFFFCGFPQDAYYPPLYHYLITLISFPLGLPLAFKFVTITSVLILPISIYYLARKFKFDPNESSLICFFVMVPISCLSLACGGTLFSLFTVGLGTNALGLPLFLFYLGMYKELADKFKSGIIEHVPFKSFLVLTVLASVIALTHFVVTFAAIVSALIITFNSLNKNIISFAIKHAIIAFMVCGFFFIPLVFYSGLIGDAGTILSMGFFLTIPMFLLILLGGAASLLERDERFDRTFFTLIAAFAIIIFLDFGQIGLPMHSYRFLIFFLIFSMMLPMKLIFNKIEDKAAKFFFLFSFFILLGWQAYIMVGNNPRLEINYNQLFKYKDASTPFSKNIDMPKLDGRIMLFASSNPLTPRALEHLLPRLTGNYFLSGLFGDTANAAYINQLGPKIIWVLSSGKDLQTKNRVQYFWQMQNISKLLKLFQINYILTEAPINNVPEVKKISVRDDKPPFHLYKIADSRVVELINYRPYFTVTNWKSEAGRWVESPDPKILVKAPSLPMTFAASEDAVEICNIAMSPPKIILKVHAKEDVPILVKISYFPRWKAYADGKEKTIYQVAPSLMLVYAKGEVIFEYKFTLIDLMGIGLTIFGLSLLLFEFFMGRNAPFNRK